VITVYTSIYGGKDTLWRPQPTVGFEWRVFREPAMSAIFPDDPVRSAKLFKVLAHNWIDTTFSVWIDGSVELMPDCDIPGLVKRYLSDGCGMAAFRHPNRGCVYEEAVVCKSGHLDDPRLIDAQMGRYMDEEYPRDNGLAACGVLLRRHDVPGIGEFNNAWWGEIMRGSKRDQLSFPYVAWKLRTTFRWIEGSMADNGFLVRRHDK
jgi:hypothetical protein